MFPPPLESWAKMQYFSSGRWLKPPPAVMFRKWWPAHHTSTVDEKKSSLPPGMCRVVHVWCNMSSYQANDQRYLSAEGHWNHLKHRVFHFLGVGFSFQQKKHTAFQIHPPGGLFFFIPKDVTPASRTSYLRSNWCHANLVVLSTLWTLCPLELHFGMGPSDFHGT